MVRQGEKLKKLKVPYCPDDKGNEGHFEINTIEEKVIRDYTGYDFNRIDTLDVFEYWLLLRDAVIYNYSQTDEGQKYLERCWRLEQTEPDRKALREKFKRGGK